MSQSISSSLAIVQELLIQLGERPGLTYDYLRARLQELEALFQRGPTDPPLIEVRLHKLADLASLQGQVRAVVEDAKTRLGPGGDGSSSEAPEK